MPFQIKLVLAIFWVAVIGMLVKGEIQVGGNLSPVVVDRKKTPVRYWIQLIAALTIAIIATYTACISEW